MSDNDLIGWQVVIGHWRRHIATIRQEGPATYRMRTFCGGISRTLGSEQRPDAVTLESNVLNDAVCHPWACLRCSASYKRRMWGAA